MAPYPKMMFHRDYHKHADPVHDIEIAVKRRAHTCIAIDPADQAKKEAEGWRDTYDPAAFEDVGDDAPATPEENQPNGHRRVKPRREAVSTE